MCMLVGKVSLELCFFKRINGVFKKNNCQEFVCLSVCVYFIGSVIFIATTKTPIDSERASKSESGCQLFGSFFSIFSSKLTNLDSMNTNLKTVLKSEFWFGRC